MNNSSCSSTRCTRRIACSVEIEPAVEVAKVEFATSERRQRRGGEQDFRGLGGVIFGAPRNAGGARPAGTAAGQRAAWPGGDLAQRRQILEPVEPPLGAVGDLGGDAEDDKPFEQSRRVVRRHAERLAERGGRDQRGRGQDVDGLGRARIAAPAGDRGAGGQPSALDAAQQRDPVFGLGGERSEKMPDPGLARPRCFGSERAGAGQERAVEGGQPAPQPIPNQRGADRRPLAALIEPGMDRKCGAEQRRLRRRRPPRDGPPPR